MEPAVAFGWPHQPIRSLGQLAIFKDRQAVKLAQTLLTRDGLAVSKSMLVTFIAQSMRLS